MPPSWRRLDGISFAFYSETFEALAHRGVKVQQTEVGGVA
jgi:hypothetical protein